MNEPLYASPEIIDYLRELSIVQNENHTPRELPETRNPYPVMFNGREIKPIGEPLE